MTILERLNSLRAKAKAQIKPESSEEEINACNEILSELDEIEKEHNAVVDVNVKYKDTIVSMVLKEGNSKPPVDESGGGEPQSMDEFLAEFKAKQEEK